MSQLDSPNINYIDKYYKYIVSGFIHKLERNDDDYYIIPDLVFGVILLFYYENEFWSRCGKDMSITSSNITTELNDIIKYVSGYTRYTSANTAYGNIIIDQNRYGKNAIYKWIFKINLTSSIHSKCIIGIHSSSGFYDVDYNAFSKFLVKENSKYYAKSICYVGNGVRQKFCQLITNDDDQTDNNNLERLYIPYGIDKIAMIFNSKRKTLQFIDNGRDTYSPNNTRIPMTMNMQNYAYHKNGNMFKDIDLKQQCRIAISLSYSGDSVQIIEFKMYSIK